MSIKDYNKAIEEGESLKEIALSYGEIASNRIKKIKFEVERNRLFFNEIANIYNVVQQQAKLKKVSLKKDKKTISVLLSSNYRFYGNIDNEVIHSFLEQTPKLPTDRIVVGKTAQVFLKSMNYFNNYKSLEFKNDLPSADELLSLTQLTKDYSQVLVFYPQLSTLLVQKPVVSDITQSSLKNSTSVGLSYVIFEPELTKILQFFDSSIISLLLEQTFFEAELSRTASRILSMDHAQIEANRFIETQRQLKAHAQRSLENIRLLESLTSIMALRKDI